MRKTLILIIGITISISANSQIKISAEFRPRAEYRNGYNKLRSDESESAFFISQRSRIKFDYESEKLKTCFSIQDVRVWGDEENFNSTGTYGDNASIDLHQAWIQYSISSKQNIKIGRQELKYDDQRLLSARNWNQNGVVYDAFLYKYLTNKFIFDLGLSLNNQQENTFGNNYSSEIIKTLNFLHTSQKINDQIKLSEIVIASGYTKPYTDETIYIMGTYGGNLFYDNEKISGHLSAYYQNGKTKLGTGINAYMASILLSYKFFENCIFSAGNTYISGNDHSKTDSSYLSKEHVFNILYGTRHKFYGLMDYFSNINSATGNGGLIDNYFSFRYNYKKITPVIDIHYFLLQNIVSDPNYADFVSLNKQLATEIDLSIEISVQKDINLSLGYSAINPYRSLKLLQNADTDNNQFNSWFWLILTVNPVIFSSK